VGQGKARPDPAQTGLRYIQRHRRAHHRRAHPSRNGSARSRPDPQGRRQNSAKEAPPHAIRKPKGVTFEKPGDVVQIDNLSIYPLPGVSKHFNAYDPFAKWTVARPCKRATAKNAAEFLDAVLMQMPDPVKAIQIDGGSEFMAEFEQACANKKGTRHHSPTR
jgi:putative transposase